MDTLEKAQNLVKTEVFCCVPSLILDNLLSNDDFLSAMMRYDEENDEYADPLEFWFVSSWLARQLKEVGGIVYDLGTCSIWGRETSGQSIYLDGIMQEVADQY